MSSGKNAYPPRAIEGRTYIFWIDALEQWYVGRLKTILETVDGLRAAFVFGDGEERWLKYSHCYETDRPLSAIAPPEDIPMLPRLTYGTPATPQSADPFPFVGAYIPNNPAGRAAPVGRRAGYSAPPPGAASGRHGPGNGPGQYAGAPVAVGRGIPPQGVPYTGGSGRGILGQGMPYSGTAAPSQGQGGPYYGAPPGQAAPYNAAPGFQGKPAYGQGNAAMPPPGSMPPYYGMAGNTAAPGYGTNYYGTPGAGPSNAQGYGDGGYGTYGDGGASAPGSTSSSGGRN